MSRQSLGLILTLLLLGSCQQKPPYEIRSPCVSIESNDVNVWAHNPCIRRPANRDIA